MLMFGMLYCFCFYVWCHLSRSCGFFCPGMAILCGMFCSKLKGHSTLLSVDYHWLIALINRHSLSTHLGIIFVITHGVSQWRVIAIGSGHWWIRSRDRTDNPFW